MILNSRHPPTPYINVGAAFAMNANDSMLILCIMWHVNEYPECNISEISSMIAHIDFDSVFLKISVKNCIVGMLLTCPTAELQRAVGAVAVTI